MLPLGSSAWVSWILTFWKSTKCDLFTSNMNLARLLQVGFRQIDGWKIKLALREWIYIHVYGRGNQRKWCVAQILILIPLQNSMNLLWLTWVYLNCCSTSFTMVWQSRQTNVPLTSSGCTGWVLTTWPVIRSNDPTLDVVNSRTL